MKKIIFCLIVCLNTVILNGQNKVAYSIFNSEGKETTYAQMLENAQNSELVFFGELHDNPIAHWLEFELTSDLYKVKKQNLVLGAEMFESDNQLILNEYLEGLINQKNFEAEARLWNNYKTDYKPLVELAKTNSLKFIATNVPRRYASMVSAGGFDALTKLSDDAKHFLAPLPIDYNPDLPGYKAMLQMGGMHGGMVPEGMSNMPKAQAIKDATMAYFIMQNLMETGTFIHFNGSYHSNNHEGIVWYIIKSKPNIKLITIAAVTQANVSALDDENKGIADFIIVIPESMTRTY